MNSSSTPDAGRSFLLLDIGNTNLKWAWLKGGRMSAMKTGAHRAEGVTALASSFWSRAARPAHIIVANVAGQPVADELRQWCLAHWGIEPEFITTSVRALGVENGYREPGKLGVDRWLALIAVWQQIQGAACVMDCGTAITIDALGADGRHRGGLILPGLAMMREALVKQTWIPCVNESEGMELLARDTGSAITGGTLHAAAALVERVMTATARQSGSWPHLVLTGSDASRLKAVLNLEAEINPELIMQGLACMVQLDESR